MLNQIFWNVSYFVALQSPGIRTSGKLPRSRRRRSCTRAHAPPGLPVVAAAGPAGLAPLRRCPEAAATGYHGLRTHAPRRRLPASLTVCRAARREGTSGNWGHFCRREVWAGTPYFTGYQPKAETSNPTGPAPFRYSRVSRLAADVTILRPPRNA